MKRREFLVASGAAALAAGMPVFAQAASIRQGYQTNMWGMPTYYLLRSGALEKQGIKFEEFAVPSGNITMQQMVGRQVDLGTYAGPSFIIGHSRGQLVAVAQIEEVGKTTRVMARKELGIKRIEDLRGRKIANQTGSSVGNVFVDQIAPKAGLKKEDWQEVRMNVTDMVAAMAAKTVDAMINVEPYNSIAEAEGIATTIMNYWDIDRMPVFMAATPEFVQKNGDVLVRYLKAWLDVADDFKSNRKKVSDTIYAFFKEKGYKMSPETFEKAISTIEVNPGFPDGVRAYMDAQAQVLLREKKIKQIPDWSKALHPGFMQRARS